jgi:hypothetical protein
MRFVTGIKLQETPDRLNEKRIYIWSSTYDRPHLRPQKNNKLIINQDVLLRTPITQVRRHIDDLK